MSTIIEIKGRFYQKRRLNGFDKSNPCAECDILKNSTSEISDCVTESNMVGKISCEPEYTFKDVTDTLSVELKVI